MQYVYGSGQSVLWALLNCLNSNIRNCVLLSVVSLGMRLPVQLNLYFSSYLANEFPSSFESIVCKILRLLFHVLAHLYHCHFREVVLLNLHAHLNCVFAHLTLFNHRFQLIELKETEILQDLVLALKVHSDGLDSSCDEDKKCGGLDGDAAASVEGSQPSADAPCNIEDKNVSKPDLILMSTAVVDISNEEKDLRSCEMREFC